MAFNVINAHNTQLVEYLVITVPSKIAALSCQPKKLFAKKWSVDYVSCLNFLEKLD